MQNTLRDILGLPLSAPEREKYNANSPSKSISTIKIDGVEISGYKAFSFVRKLTYVDSPQRSTTGNIGNLNGYAVFITPELQIDFSLLFIDSYRTIMNMIYSKREFLVECYDVVRDKRVQERMYFEPEELPKLWTIARDVQSTVELLGVLDYTITMVGTNNPVTNVVVNFYDYNKNLIGSTSGSENTEFLLTPQDQYGNPIFVEDAYDQYGNRYTFDNIWLRPLVEEGDKDSGRLYMDKETYRLFYEKPWEEEKGEINFYGHYAPVLTI